MARPSTRLPGFAGRAQYGLFIGDGVAVGGVLFAVLLLIVAILDPKGFNVLRGAALDATLPISSAGRSVIRGVTNSGDMVSNYFLAASQNDDLKRELEAAHNQDRKSTRLNSSH